MCAIILGHLDENNFVNMVEVIKAIEDFFHAYIASSEY